MSANPAIFGSERSFARQRVRTRNCHTHRVATIRDALTPGSKYLPPFRPAGANSSATECAASSAGTVDRHDGARSDQERRHPCLHGHGAARGAHRRPGSGTRGGRTGTCRQPRFHEPDRRRGRCGRLYRAGFWRGWRPVRFTGQEYSCRHAKRQADKNSPGPE